MPRALLAVCTILFMGLLQASPCRAEASLQTLRVFEAVADATLLEGSPDTPQGDETTLLAGYALSQEDGGTAPGAMRALLRFDLDTLPDGATLESATLMLRLVASWDTPETTVLCTAQPALDPWDEASVTWSNAPAVGARVGWIATTHGAWDWYSLDITDLAQAWHRGDLDNQGVLLRGEESRPNWRAFCSREGHYPAQLVLTLSLPTPTATAMPSPTATPSATLQPTVALPTIAPDTTLHLPLIMAGHTAP